ncbi:MAG TPA: hypothetical protein VF190_04240, partial [Rhodothermales bacterium]
LAQLRPSLAQNQDDAPVLRGRALEIVDQQGRVRASISVQPPVTMDGRTYPETVLLRLTDPRNGPVVKMTASVEGSALSLSDDAEGGVQLYARSAGNLVRVVTAEGEESVLRP